MYYRYNESSVITEKSEAELTGENICQSVIDFDIDLYDVYVGKVIDNSLVYFTKKAKPAEVLAKNLKVTQEIVNVHDDDISDLYEYVADSIYKECSSDLGLSE